MTKNKRHFPGMEGKHFLLAKINYLIFIILILSGITLFLSMGLIFKDQIEKIKFQDLPLIKRIQPARMNSNSPLPKATQITENPASKPAASKGEPRALKQTLENEDLALELKRINNLIALDDQNANAFYNRGWIYEYKGKLEKAVEDYTRALTIDKGHTDAYYNRGLVYISQGEYKLAIKDFTEVIKLERGDADVYNNRGSAYMQTNEFESALNDYNTAIKISPKDADLYYNRGVVSRSMGEYGKSRQDFQKAADMGHKQARELLGLPPIKK